MIQRILTLFCLGGLLSLSPLSAEANVLEENNCGSCHRLRNSRSAAMSSWSVTTPSASHASKHKLPMLRKKATESHRRARKKKLDWPSQLSSPKTVVCQNVGWSSCQQKPLRMSKYWFATFTQRLAASGFSTGTTNCWPKRRSAENRLKLRP